MSFHLRDYQNDIINKTRDYMLAGKKSILIQSPTGSGKTALTAHMLGSAAAKGLPSLFIVHRRELIKQSTRTFSMVGIRHGIIASGFEADLRIGVQLASVQTLARRLDKLKTPKLIIWDETHHIAAGSWSKIHAFYPEAFHIGLTATPERLDGHGLADFFQVMINGPSVESLIKDGFLAPYKLFAPGGINTHGVHKRMGDFAQAELAAAANKPKITGDAIKHYQQHATGKRAVVFCVSVEHSQSVVAQFNAAGIKAEHIDGETDHDIRDSAIKRFERGETLVLSNVELFGEGFDLPAIEVAILLRPTQSLGLYLQQVGRVLRPNPGKAYALILDHAGNCQRHGLPDDPREWTLAGRDSKVRSAATGEAVRICKKCFAAQASGTTACKFCGTVFEIQYREVEHVAGTLTEVDIAAARKAQRQEQGQAQTLQDLIAVGKSRGMKNPYGWAHYVFRARQAKKLSMGRV